MFSFLCFLGGEMCSLPFFIFVGVVRCMANREEHEAYVRRAEHVNENETPFVAN